MAVPKEVLMAQPDLSLFWLPDDTEESIVGTNLHQEVIRVLATELDIALAPAVIPNTHRSGESGVGSQTRIEGFRRRQGSLVPLYPDIFVYPHPIDPLRATHTLAEHGPPALVIEVLSPSTAEGDLN